MAQDDKDYHDNERAEQAMNTVLRAEVDARQAVAVCASEAESLLRDARQAAQHIRERVDDRITRIQRRCSRAITDQVKQLRLEQESSMRGSHRYKLDVDTVNIVVEQIAAILTSTAGSTDGDEQ